LKFVSNAVIFSTPYDSTYNTMDKKDIIKILKETASLMELNEENDFKIKSYSNAVFNLEKYPGSLEGKSEKELQDIDGVGKSVALAIREILDHGTFELYANLNSKTPEGVKDMLKIKGVGAKKIRTLWRELDINSLEKLIEACQQDKISSIKGFGQKTQDNIQKEARFILENKYKLLYAEAERLADDLLNTLREILDTRQISITGDMRRKCEVIGELSYLIGTENILSTYERLDELNGIEFDIKNSGPYCRRGKFTDLGIKVSLAITQSQHYASKLILHTGSEAHLSLMQHDGKNLFSILGEKHFKSEEEIYESVNSAFVPPVLREGFQEITFSKDNSWPELLEWHDLKGTLHNHSTYSDGQNSIREMAQQCIEMGLEYFGVSDHSQSAFYANGLQEYQIKKQHEEIDALNEELKPFRIFKGIESDILSDGSLDYPDDVLASFDFVVASIHSGLNMDIKKATQRLLKAIQNPYTTFLGHATGRLLLRREGYPVDHKVLIDACAEHGVIIEINANPRRLDLDWRWIPYALEKNVMLSINPDAHAVDGLAHMKYGVITGQKGGLAKAQTFNCLSAKEVDQYFSNRKKKI